MRKEKLRVGLVGTGYVSQHHLRALKKLDYVQVAALCDSNLERASKAAKEAGIAAPTGVLTSMGRERLDVIHILTPPASHCALTVQALKMGCHVLVEKPMAPSSEECDRMLERRKGDRPHPLSQPLSAHGPGGAGRAPSGEGGACGDVLAVDFLRSSDYPPYAGGPMPAHYREGGYPFLDIGVHGLSLIETFLGAIRACGRTPCRNRPGSVSDLRRMAWVRAMRPGNRPHVSFVERAADPERARSSTVPAACMHVDCYLQICTVRRRLPGPKMVQRIVVAATNSASTFFKVSGNVVRFATGRLRLPRALVCRSRSSMRRCDKGAAPPVSAEEGRRIVRWAERATRGASAEKRAMLDQAAAAPPPAKTLVTGASGISGASIGGTAAQQW